LPAETGREEICDLDDDERRHSRGPGAVSRSSRVSAWWASFGVNVGVQRA
jgi:hypothetical protein